MSERHPVERPAADGTARHRSHDGFPDVEDRSMETLTEGTLAGDIQDRRAARGDAASTPLVLTRFDTAWCAVGGARGGEVVPRWFDVLPDLQVDHAQLFWAMPEEGPADGPALERLRSLSTRWLTELRALGLGGSLSIKRGEAGPWLGALAQLSDSTLIVVGPPAARGGRSETVQYLLRYASRPVLLLPDLVQPPVESLWTRIVVDGERSSLRQQLQWPAESVDWIDVAPLDPVSAVRTALRFADDVDATLLTLSRRAAALAPLALELGNVPLLVLPTAGARLPPR